MELVAGHAVGDGPDAAEREVIRCTAEPGRGVQASEERDERGAHRRELGHDVGERTPPKPAAAAYCSNSTLVHITGSARAMRRRAVAEDALDVGHVPDDLERFHSPGASRRSACCGVKVPRNAALGDLALERVHDVSVGDELDVLKIVRLALVGVRTSGVTIVHSVSPLRSSRSAFRACLDYTNVKGCIDPVVAASKRPPLGRTRVTR
jgi:hypothetical protein